MLQLSGEVDLAAQNLIAAFLELADRQLSEVIVERLPGDAHGPPNASPDAPLWIERNKSSWVLALVSRSCRSKLAKRRPL